MTPLVIPAEHTALLRAASAGNPVNIEACGGLAAFQACARAFTGSRLDPLTWVVPDGGGEADSGPKAGLIASAGPLHRVGPRRTNRTVDVVNALTNHAFVGG